MKAPDFEQNESIRTVFMKPGLYEQLERYAQENNLSVSAAARELVMDYMGTKPKVTRVRRTRRVSLWITPKMWGSMKKLAEKNSMTVTELVERAMDGKL